MLLHDRLEDRSERLVEIARSRELTVGTAESLTAGLAASWIASVPGASTVLKGGAITYCDAVKHEVLGVSDEVLLEHSAVSRECAEEMAAGAIRLLGIDIAVSLTGYAGPGIGERGEPAGTVYIGSCVRGATPTAYKYSFEGNRTEVRNAAALKAIEVLIERCMEFS